MVCLLPLLEVVLLVVGVVFVLEVTTVAVAVASSVVVIGGKFQSLRLVPVGVPLTQTHKSSSTATITTTTTIITTTTVATTY